MGGGAKIFRRRPFIEVPLLKVEMRNGGWEKKLLQGTPIYRGSTVSEDPPSGHIDLKVLFENFPSL